MALYGIDSFLLPARPAGLPAPGRPGRRGRAVIGCTSPRRGACGIGPNRIPQRPVAY